jgi:hypothetical protein
MQKPQRWTLGLVLHNAKRTCVPGMQSQDQADLQKKKKKKNRGHIGHDVASPQDEGAVGPEQEWHADRLVIS